MTLCQSRLPPSNRLTGWEATSGYRATSDGPLPNQPTTRTSLRGRCLHGDYFAERVCTCLRNCRIRRGRAWRCREAAFLDVVVAAPCVDLREFNPLRLHVGLKLESFDTYRPISLHQCGIYERCCVFLSGFPEDPSTPVKADDHRGDGAKGRTLSETRECLSLEEFR